MKYPEPESEEVRQRLQNSIFERLLWLAANSANACLVWMILFAFVGAAVIWLIGEIK